MEKTRHIPVMIDEALDCLRLKTGMVVVDATLGGGSYTRKISHMIGPSGTLIALDADKNAIERFEKQHAKIAKEITIVHSNFSQINDILSQIGITQVNAIVADLGLSSDQLETVNRGFSFLQEDPLDMRLDQSNGETLDALIARTNAQNLSKIIYEYGDERHANKIARALIEGRPFLSTIELANTIEKAVGRFYRGAKIHPATKTFQALRIAINNEYTNLETFLTSGIKLLVPTGRMSIVTFHSGEDRIVKNTFRTNAKECLCTPEIPLCVCKHKPSVRDLTKKPLQPTGEEIQKNPRARSAKLRAIEKI